MTKQKSMSQRVREMIDRGYPNKTIVEKLGVKPQIVYNMRYQINKERGLGAIGMAAPRPSAGIGAPPKRKYTRRVKPQELASMPPAEMSPERKREFAQELVAETLRHHPEFANKPPFAIAMVERPTLWQRVKGWFRGSHA